MITSELIAASLADFEDLITGIPLVRRECRVEDNINYCFVGIRRSGKSFLMYQRYRDLLARGVKPEEMLYASFEDERLSNITAPELNSLIEVKMQLSGGIKPKYVFLDEIQNIDGWEHFVRRLADMKYSVCITGSNAKMLSTDVAATLGGRFMIQPVYPYSFREYLEARGVSLRMSQPVSTPEKAAVSAAFDDYVRFGGFPEVINVPIKLLFLTNVYKAIFLGDIIRRNQIRDGAGVELLMRKLAEAVTKPVTVTRLRNVVAEAGHEMSTITVTKHLEAMKEAFLVWPVENFSGKLVQKVQTPKYYFMDSGLLATYPNRYDTALLENVVALELLRRYGKENVCYYADGRVEVDFFVPAENIAIQVCWSIRQTESTLERETRALTRFLKFKPDVRNVILTLSDREDLTVDGIPIPVRPVSEWLLESPAQA